jgi:hypothetical protein
MTRDDVVALLRASGRVRRLPSESLTAIRALSVQYVEANLSTAAREHPLGFVVLSEQIAEGVALRYHIWPEAWSVPEGQEVGETHDHCFELNSIIVSGALRQLNFRALIGENSGQHDLYQVVYAGTGGSALRETGLRARLEQLGDETFEAGTAYRLAPGEIHCVHIPIRPTATLMLAVSQPNTPPPRVFIPRGRYAPPDFPRRHLDASQVAVVRAAIYHPNFT